MPLAVETHKSDKGVMIFCTGQVLLGNEIENLSAMLERIWLDNDNQAILLDLSAVENLDICNLAPLLTLAERRHATGYKLAFAQFPGRVRQQLLFSRAIGKFSAT